MKKGVLRRVHSHPLTHHFEEQGFEDEGIFEFRLCLVVLVLCEHGREPDVVFGAYLDAQSHEKGHGPIEAGKLVL